MSWYLGQGGCLCQVCWFVSLSAALFSRKHSLKITPTTLTTFYPTANFRLTVTYLLFPIEIFFPPQCALKWFFPTSPSLLSTLEPPFPQIDIIGAMMIVWRARGEIIRSVLCSIVCSNCTQWAAHSYEQN